MPKHDCLPPRRTGRADFPHPALTQTLAAQQYASRKADLAGPPSLGLRWELCPTSRLGSVGGLSSKRNSHPLTQRVCVPAPSLHGRYPLLRYYGPVRLPIGAAPELCFPRRRWSSSRPPRRVSQVPRLIFPRVLSPSTPESPAVAFAHCFTASVRLHHTWKTGHFPFALTGPYRVRWRYGSRVRLPGLRRRNYSRPRPVGYLSNEQLQGKLLSAYEISQAFLAHQVCATLAPNPLCALAAVSCQ
jgi:hypothetical protein